MRERQEPVPRSMYCHLLEVTAQAVTEIKNKAPVTIRQSPDGMIHFLMTQGTPVTQLSYQAALFR
ncbi:hypothetical protein [Citrobacter youngae]|uniref:hypothetical protein n=1 Tax=Citrobacter youngae TaxID=133448 RepID=UPI0030DA8FF4